MAYFSSIGFAATHLPGALWTLGERRVAARTRITKEMIAGAEELAGLGSSMKTEARWDLFKDNDVAVANGVPAATTSTSGIREGFARLWHNVCAVY
jgi:hypothetical protein